MLWILCSTAMAVPDSHPTQRAVSAAPGGVAQVEAGLGGTYFVFGGDGFAGWNTGLRGSVRLSDRLHVDGLVGETRAEGCFPTCFDHDAIRGRVALGVALLERSRLRVVAFAGTGTSTQLGASVWWRSKNERVEFDASVPLAIDTFTLLRLDGSRWEDLAKPGPEVHVDAFDSLPELGFTWIPSEAHALRLGLFAYTPTVSYRLTVGGHYLLELTAGTSLLGGLASASLGASF